MLSGGAAATALPLDAAHGHVSHRTFEFLYDPYMRLLAVAFLFGIAGCGGDDDPRDGGVDATIDARDGGRDAGGDRGPDVDVDARLDGAIDGRIDGANDAGDAATDAGVDADAGPPPRTYRINGFTVGLDPVHGTLRSLVHDTLGTLVDASSDRARLISAHFPIGIYFPLSLEAGASEAAFDEVDGGVRIRWARLVPSRDEADLMVESLGRVGAIVGITPALDGRSLRFTADIGNDSTLAIYSVHFPDIEGLREPGSVAGVSTLRVGATTRAIFSGPSIGEGRVVFYPMLWRTLDLGASARTITLTAGGLGISLSETPRSGFTNQLAWIRSERDSRAARLLVRHRVRNNPDGSLTPQVAPGEGWSTEVTLTPVGVP